MSSSTVRSSPNLPTIAGDAGSGLRVLGWAYDTRGFYYAPLVGYIYSSGEKDFHYSVDVVVTDAEIDLYGRDAVHQLVERRLAAAREKVLGVRRATRRKYRINRVPRAR